MILFLETNEKLQRNGKVNGPQVESKTVDRSGNNADVNFYSYWMGYSGFTLTRSLTDISHERFAWVIGDNTGSRPSGNVSYTGKAMATPFSFSESLDGDVQHGDFYLTYNLGDNTVEIDLDFEDWDASFPSIEVTSDGSFMSGDGSGRENDMLRGSFFGPDHNEVAGTYRVLSESVIGSFGGVKDN